ncbi:MAG: tetratricopeptide repeat protein [Burkholderiales bacterium]
MAANVFADWLARGRTHQAEGRAADAVPCFRRAAREDPRSPLPHYHLGEVLWQLGLAGDAQRAFRTAAALDPGFVPPRLALAEVAIVGRDFAAARDFAGEAVTLSPGDARARLTLVATRAATGDAEALTEAAALVAAEPGFARSGALADALATALDQAPAGDARSALVAALAPLVESLPLPLVASLAARGAQVPASVAARRFTLDDLESLRRLAVALHPRDAETAARVAYAHCALAAASPPPPVPLLWPRRTAGTKLRVAWLCPAPGGPGWRDWEKVLAALPADRDACDHVVLCTGDADATRAALAATPLAVALQVALPERPDAATARILAARDCDVLVDGAGLAAPTSALLAARPARAVWAYASGQPMHVAPIVQRTFASGDEIVGALSALRTEVVAGASSRYAADEIGARWDAAVRAHQQGEIDAALAGYRDVLAEQPGFAPALHLAGELHRARGDAANARDAFEAAIAAAPEFVEARLAGAELAMDQRAYDDAARLAREGLARAPGMAALWRLQARAELARRDVGAAEQTLQRGLAIAPADADLHFEHGVVLQTRGDASGAARAYQRALTFAPAMAAADFNLGVLFQQQGNRTAAIAAYRNALAGDRAHAAAYKNLGEMLLATGQVDAWLANFRAFEQNCPKALPLAVYALEACQYQGDFAGLDRYLEGLRRDDFKARDDAELVDCLEELLFLLLYFDVDAATMLWHAQVYDAATQRLTGPPVPRPPVRKPGPLRIGYLSADLRNHVMGKMMWQAIAHHDRTRYALHFYSTSAERDEWTEKFAAAGRFEALAALDDVAAAERIAADDLDLLVDLSTHTRGARPGILARKPARVQITHIASAGCVGLSAIDFKLTDHYADVPENQEFQIERMLPMDGCVFPYRHIAPAAQHPYSRAALGLADDAVVIGAFVNPLKLSRRCLRLWRGVLERIPRARLAFSPATPALRGAYVRLAAAAGIAEDRLLFLPQGRDDAGNQARYHVVDLVLDTLPYGGVNGTLEALDMGVPVVTLVGKRHGERTSYSILRNLGVDATIAASGRDYVDIAVRLADDAAFRADVRAAIARGLAGSPLVDMAQHTRNLEAAYERALAARAPGGA